MIHQILNLVKSLQLGHFDGAIVYPNISILNGMQQHLVLAQYGQQMIVTASPEFFNIYSHQDLVELKLRDGAVTIGFISTVLKRAKEQSIDIISVSTRGYERLMMPESQIKEAKKTFIKMGFRSVLR